MSSRAASVTAVIAAAGSGERLGAGGPKAFVRLAGRPLVEWSIAAMRAAPSVRSIVVACPPEVLAGSSSSYPDVGKVGPDSDSMTFVAGGATRAESVSNALQVVETELVAIHDAARPLATPELVEGVIATLLAAPDAAGAIAAVPVTDTIKRAAPKVPEARLQPFPHDGGAKAAISIAGTVDRGELWAAQTPQVFRVDALRRALEADPSQLQSATDEAMIVEGTGGTVLIHPASSENLKVTTPLDLRVAELLLSKDRPGPNDQQQSSQ
ncbi:MAG TPA: 2-C-methyl-D-erythritol 4-phosphate cytidylyltransferase [Solirubrobacterales bacterium]|nr:2-C-methyl-D-erythritol 4-phosphate cytidylyltransferase [Solirubrobacterales bacterium]